MRGGKKVVSSKRFFPGYILVEIHMTDHAWHVVKNTPKVTGFVGAGAKPTPLTREESKSSIRSPKRRRSPSRATRSKGDQVPAINEGPLTPFNGVVDEVNNERNTLKVMVTILGRRPRSCNWTFCRWRSSSCRPPLPHPQPVVARTSWKREAGSRVADGELQQVWQKDTGDGEAPIRGGKADPPPPVGTALGLPTPRQYHGLLQELQREAEGPSSTPTGTLSASSRRRRRRRSC